METTKTRSCVFSSFKAKTIALIVSIAACVALPHFFHALGAVTDMGTALGETFLPMHIAVFAVALLAGPVVGAVCGALSPLISFLITPLTLHAPMPTQFMLPFMVIELATYGAVCGAFAGVKMPNVVKVLISQIAGRGVRAVAIVIGFYAFSSPIGPAVIWSSVVAGLPGIILQLVLVPLFVYYVKRQANNE